MTKKRICFYHADGDGYCSAAIVAIRYDWKLKLVPMDYGPGWPFPWDEVDAETDVIMVDFSLQPFSQMPRLLNTCKSLLWIDHHKTIVKDYHEWADRTGLHIEGPKQIGEAACELTWCYYHDPDEDVPMVVNYLGRYDVWEWQDLQGAIEFQWGFRSAPNNSPVDAGGRPFWEALLGKNPWVRSVLENRLISNGAAVLAQKEKDNQQAAKSGCFVTQFYGLTAEDHKFLACNVGGVNSQFFELVLEEFPEADAVLTFHYRQKAWHVRLYSIEGRKCPDLGAIAREMGSYPIVGGEGGGHPGAAGFTWLGWQLPFNTPLRRSNER